MIPVKDSIPSRSAPIAMWILIGVNAAVFFFEMQELGHPVSNDLPVEIVQLMALYPQPTKKTRSVQYLREKYPREVRETP